MKTDLQAIQKGNMEVAKIHAENSIRQKNQSLNYRRMSARIDAVAARVQTAVTTKQVSSPFACSLSSVGSVIGSISVIVNGIDLFPLTGHFRYRYR